MTTFAEPTAFDMHAHYVPPAYRRALADAGIDHPDGFPYVPEWSAESAVSAMDALGIELALISVSSPGVALGPGTDAIRLARDVNDEGADAETGYLIGLRITEMGERDRAAFDEYLKKLG